MVDFIPTSPGRQPGHPSTMRSGIRTFLPRFGSDEAVENNGKRAFIYCAILLLITAVALALRIALLDYTNLDLVDHFLPWLERIRNNGFWPALAKPFSKYGYTPFYTYAIGLADAILPASTDGKTIIKSVSIVFDFVAAASAFLLVRLRWKEVRHAMVAYAAVLFAPTVVLNSAYWGQSDIVYAAFLLACIYFLLKQAPIRSMLCFGAAFAIKAQAAWLAPFVLMMVLRGRLRGWHLLLIPVVYVAFALPALYVGRSLLEVATIYLTQAATQSTLTYSAANLYFFPDYFFAHLGLWSEGIPLIAKCGLMLSVGVASFFAWQTSRGRMDEESMLMAALVSVLIVPQCLPHMHNRYFFAADILAIVLALWNPAWWWVAILMQFDSFVTYISFLWGNQLMAQPVPAWLAVFRFTNNLQPVTGLIAVASLANAALLIVLWRALLKRLKHQGRHVKPERLYAQSSLEQPYAYFEHTVGTTPQMNDRQW